ncbi:MAG: DUF3237 domain-containing protein [Bryobacteraceae bacterium]|jgi:hypothetical protein
MNELKSKHLFDLTLQLHPILELGATPFGGRRVAPISGGQFAGERLRGEVLPHAGSDFLLTRADGAFQQDVRLALGADDGAVILMTYRGVRHGPPEVLARMARGELVEPSEYYFRTAPFFETAAPKYAWLNVIVSVGIGERRPDGVLYRVFEIL